MSFIPSCDNKGDAIKSLANIYAAQEEDVKRVLENRVVLEIAESAAELESPHFLALTGRMLRSSPRCEITHAAYYHSTSYDGCSSWFDEGLLGSSAGITRFVEKISELIPAEKRKAVAQTCRSLVARRSELEGSTGNDTGPFAWNTLAAATTTETGVVYQVPEAIRDLWGRSFIENSGLIDLTEIIRQNLKPVVVRLKGKISDLDTYCSALWSYLLSENGEAHLTHKFKGNGVTIPRECILAIIDV